MITQTINLNLIPGSPLPRINVSQYDNGSRTLQFNLYNGVSDYEIPSGASVYIVGTKADNTGFEYACTFDGSLVSVDITDQMTVFAGEVQAELRIIQSDEVLGTANFIINVESAALSDDTQISETDIPIIQRIPEILEEAEEYADTAHKWASFGADTETPSSTNNAKYWAEQSQVYATGALHWKGSVAFANIPTSGMIVGDFYNITNDFTTDSRFDEGAGIKCAAGTNIVWDTNNKWDILTPSTVASQVKYDGTTSGLSATTVQSAIDEVVDISGNTSSALVEQSIGTFPEFAISTNSADSYYSDGRGGVRDSNDKIIIIGMCRYNEENSGQYYVGFMLYGTSAQALAQSSYTQYGSISSSRTFVTPQGNTVYVAWQSYGWVYNTVTNPYTASSTTVTINGNDATLNNVFVQNTSGIVSSSQSDKMLLTIVDEVLFGTKEYSSGIYQVKSNNEIISLFENSVAHNEPATTSSQAYSVGQYMMNGDNLKKVTSAIASGESITGNNTSNTTVGEELRQLNSDLSAIGTIVESTPLATVVTRTWSAKRRLTVGAGTWLIRGYLLIASDNSGIRQINIGNTSGDGTVMATATAVNGAPTSIEYSLIIHTTSTVTYYLNAMHSSTINSELAMNRQYFQAVKLGN